ncbi:MAG: hypothetical protein K0S53_678 [Bacteroidetes bacterium]|jgi:hypothetical protein|nr:hypothetical protein [Bacteroidota bacterium]
MYFELNFDSVDNKREKLEEIISYFKKKIKPSANENKMRLLKIKNLPEDKYFISSPVPNLIMKMQMDLGREFFNQVDEDIMYNQNLVFIDGYDLNKPL